MSRLLSRVWDKEEKKFIDPGDFVVSGEGCMYIYAPGGFDGFRDKAEPDRYIQQQQTTAVDKTQATIYEGDILLMSGVHRVEVIWSTRDSAWMLQNKETNMRLPMPPDIVKVNCEIVGNIFEGVTSDVEK